ncbi:MAG: class I SAM-dependent methyltransferase [Myxococcota bacterium]
MGAAVASWSGASSLVRRTAARLQAAGRVGFYGASSKAMWKSALPWTQLEEETRDLDLRDAYDLHVRVLQRKGMRHVLRAVEKEDLATLPFFAAFIPLDLLRVARKRRGGLTDLPVSPPDTFPYPSYYLHDFHHQANGNLSLRAALTYEWQIRFLFLGTNRLMRQGVVDEIPPGDHLRILDVACGTASWFTQARLQGRHHRMLGVDLSPHYLRVARLFRGKHAEFQRMAAEALDPGWTGRFDVVTCIWMFHEMPQDARDRATEEMVRVLKPGGKLVFMDAVQPADVPHVNMRGVGEHFEDFFAEPYFEDYLRMDLPTHFARHGLQLRNTTVWYRSKVMALYKAQ